MFLIFKLDVVHLNIFLFQIILFDKRYFYYKPTFRKEVQYRLLAVGYEGVWVIYSASFIIF
jgi:hypothetical protein